MNDYRAAKMTQEHGAAYLRAYVMALSIQESQGTSAATKAHFPTDMQKSESEWLPPTPTPSTFSTLF